MFLKRIQSRKIRVSPLRDKMKKCDNMARRISGDKFWVSCGRNQPTDACVIPSFLPCWGFNEETRAVEVR